MRRDLKKQFASNGHVATENALDTLKAPFLFCPPLPCSGEGDSHADTRPFCQLSTDKCWAMQDVNSSTECRTSIPSVPQKKGT